MTREEVLRDLKMFFVQELLDGKDEGLDGTTPLLELGLIDSFSVLRLQEYITEKFGVNVPSSEVTVPNLKDLNSLSAMVLRLKGQ
jgi:acyl carrier protein